MFISASVASVQGMSGRVERKLYVHNETFVTFPTNKQLLYAGK